MAYQKKCSASQINLYHECPFKYFLKYKRGIKEPKTKALIKGSLVHATIEEFYKLNPRNCNINLKNYKTEFLVYITQVLDKVLIRPQKYFGKELPSFKDELKSLCNDDLEYIKEIADVKIIINNYIQIFLMQFEQFAMTCEFFNQAWYSVRIKFSELELSTDNFIGYIDSAIEKDGALVLVDYKTSKYFKLGHSESYERQLKIYAGMYYKIHGVVPDYICIYFVRYGIQCMYPINKETIEVEVDKIINEFLDDTQSNDPEDYVKNYGYQFCTSCNSKNKGKSWCFYQKYCDNEID